MIKNILVCTDGSPFGDTACDFAIYLSKQLETRLSGLHVLDSRMLEGPLMSDISGWVGAQPFGDQLQQFRNLMQEKGEAIINAFNKKCEENSIEPNSWLKMGHPIRIILEEENKTELLVIGQKGEHAEWGGELMGSTVERLVRQSFKPCLVTPENFSEINKILVAYDGSGHSSRALQEAAELASAMSIPISVLSVAEDKDMDEANKLSREGMELAQSHECKATHMVGKGLADEIILEMAAEHDYGLIVMGAYGHTRIREMILGSTTTQVVANANTPVMLVR